MRCLILINKHVQTAYCTVCHDVPAERDKKQILMLVLKKQLELGFTF